MTTYDVPTTLSPSRIEAFLSCPLAFRFRSLDQLPDPPTLATVRGTMVHRALELFHTLPAEERNANTLTSSVDAMLAEFVDHPDIVYLGITGDAYGDLSAQCHRLSSATLDMEDPAAINAIGLELNIEAPVGPVTLRGIIDRLERAGDGSLIVTDYKTGRAPKAGYEKRSLGGVHLYSLMCELTLGERPQQVRLMYVSSKETITDVPTDQSTRFMSQRVTAVHGALAQSCRSGEFRTKTSALCKFCAYQPWCPEFGGDPTRAVLEAPAVLQGGA